MTVDPRALRFSAWLTTIVLVLVLVLGSGWLLPAQTATFALGAFDAVGTAGYLFGFEGLGVVATACALAAAVLNAAFGPRLGCELYLRWRRIIVRRTPSRHPEGAHA